MLISLTPEQEAWIEARVRGGEFASAEDAARRLIDERILERAIEEDDLGWAKPYVDAARSAVALQEYDTRVERWLRNAVVPVAAAMDADPNRGIPAETVFADLRALYAQRPKDQA